jgi:hypothetical protein
MRRFLFILGVLWFVTVISIHVARAVGQGRENLQVQAIHLDYCELPCFMGITLGKTGFEEARQTFTAMPSVSIERLRAVTRGNGGMIRLKVAQSVWTTIFFTDGIASGVVISGADLSKDMAVFGDLFPLYGTPQCVYRNPQSGRQTETVYFSDEARGINIRVFAWKPLNWATRIDAVQIWRRDPAIKGSLCGQCFRWHGPRGSYGVGSRYCSTT